MLENFTLGADLEAFVQSKLISGQYDDPSEVVRDALRLMAERDRRAAALDAALALGIADADAGLVHDAEEVFAELIAELEALPDHPSA